MFDGVRPVLKRIAFAIAGSAPVIKTRLKALRESGALTVLCFHRVANDDGSSYPPLRPDLFDAVLSFCASNYTVLNFSDLSDYRGARKPPLIVSFDDGYLDFCEHAAPLLGKHGIRCNLNVIPACIESGRPPLNVVAQDFVGRAPESLLANLDVPGFGPIDRAAGRSMIGSRLSNFIKNKPIARQHELAAHLLPQFERFEEFRPTPMMTLEHVRSVADRHELGAHSFEHATLTKEDEAYVIADARRCLDYFGESIGVRTDIYAIPNGATNPLIEQTLKTAGFRQILLTGDAHSRPQRTEHNRFTMYGDSPAEMRFRATGFVRH